MASYNCFNFGVCCVYKTPQNDRDHSVSVILLDKLGTSRWKVGSYLPMPGGL